MKKILLAVIGGILLSSCVIEDNGCDTYVVHRFSHYEYDEFGREYEVTVPEVVTDCYY